MKNLSIKWKLAGLAAMLLANTILVSGVLFYGNYKEGVFISEIADVQLPAVRNMTLVDMMHDGLRAVALRAIVEANNSDEAIKKEVAEELKEMSDNINTYLANIDKLDIKPETRAAIEKAKPAVEAYTKSTEEIVAIGLAGQRQMAIDKLPDFQKAFEVLEGELETLGGLIESNSEATNKEAHEFAAKIKIVSLALILFGLIVGVLFSVWIIKSLMQTLMATIDQLDSSSREVAAASAQSASLATELSEASTQQASSLQETMASAEEISAMVSQNAETANKAKAVVESNQVATEEGAHSVSDMISAISEIKTTNDEILTQMETSNKEFGDIVKIISEIGEKTKVINDIVFQTKLLSFNASVEAARAGEHGKGFAVVAEEVGNLAQMSGNAAKEISDMLTDSIKQVNEIVGQTTTRVDRLVEIGKDKISMGQSTAEKCRAALNKIADNAKVVTEMIGEITRASKEQAQGVSEINKAIGQLDQVTQQNSSVAQQSSSQAEQLNGEAGALGEAVERLVRFARGDRYVEDNKQQGPAHTAKVLNIGAHKKSVPQHKDVAPRPQSEKKVAGSDVVPSSEAQGFEEF